MQPFTIEYLNDQEYDITIHRTDDEFLLHLPELNLFGQNKDLKKAHKNLEQAKQNLFESYLKAGKSSQIPLPKNMTERENLKKSLAPFFIKLGAFALVSVLLISAANISLTYALQQAPRKIAQKAARAAIQNFGITLEQVARQEFTPDKEQRIRQGISKFVAALKPFMDEFEPLYPKY